MKKLILAFAILGSLGLSNLSMAAITKFDASSVPATPICVGGAMPAGQTACRTTPTVYKVKVFEMGMCTAHPYGASRDSGTFDASTCTKVFSSATGSEVDVAASIGAASSLIGETFPPAEGTFKYPYMMMGPEFTVDTIVKGVVGSGNAGRSYGAAADGSSTDITVGGSSVNFRDLLKQFSQSSPPTTCVSGYVNSPIGVGTLDGYLTKDTKARVDSVTDFNNVTKVCNNVTRLVGVMELTTPFSITPTTKSVTFQFNITNYGVDVGANGAGAIDGIGSAPFSGYFETTE